MTDATQPRQEKPRRRDEDRPEQLPTHENTRPRDNQEVDHRDLERSLERMGTVLGR